MLVRKRISVSTQWNWGSPALFTVIPNLHRLLSCNYREGNCGPEAETFRKVSLWSTSCFEKSQHLRAFGSVLEGGLSLATQRPKARLPRPILKQVSPKSCALRGEGQTELSPLPPHPNFSSFVCTQRSIPHPQGMPQSQRQFYMSTPPPTTAPESFQVKETRKVKMKPFHWRRLVYPTQ